MEGRHFIWSTKILDDCLCSDNLKVLLLNYHHLNRGQFSVGYEINFFNDKPESFPLSSDEGEI